MQILQNNITKVILISALIIVSFIAQSMAGSTRNVVVEINKGVLLKLSGAASSIVIANPDIADVQVVSPKMIYINGRSVGETSILAIDENDKVIVNANVSVNHNLSNLVKAVKQSFPREKVKFSSTDSAIILRGKVSSPITSQKINKLAMSFLKENQNIVNLLDTSGGDQVMLKVKIAEVSRSELKRFGISLESLLNTGNFLFGIGTGRDVFDATAGTFTRTALDNSLFTQVNTGSVSINGVIDALEDDGLITVLAEPNLTTKSGVKASFLAGGEFPIPVVGQDNSVTIEFRPFGVSLDFTPIVMSENKISLAVAPEVSAISTNNAVEANGFVIPSITTRRVSTTVELGSGESFAIAGLMRADGSNDIEKVPGLGDIPVLGNLFRSSEFRNDQTELVIIVTPYIVNAVKDIKKLKTPLDGYKPATDMDRVFQGKLYQEDTMTKPNNTPQKSNSKKVEVLANRRGGAVNRMRLQGPSGFIVR